MNVQYLSSTAWAFAYLDLMAEPLMQSISAAALNKLNDFHTVEADAHPLQWALWRTGSGKLAVEMYFRLVAKGVAPSGVSLGLMLTHSEWRKSIVEENALDKACDELPPQNSYSGNRGKQGAASPGKVGLKMSLESM